MSKEKGILTCILIGIIFGCIFCTTIFVTSIAADAKRIKELLHLQNSILNNIYIEMINK